MGQYAESGIKGWSSLEELRWLYDRAGEMESVVEVGSWAGRSTHALLSSCPGLVWAVDDWRPTAHWFEWNHRVKPLDLFLESVGRFPRLRVCRSDSLTASVRLPDVDFVFVDADHSYDGVRADLEAWLPKAKKLIAVHDCNWAHPGVRRAVREIIGPVERIGSIGFAWLVTGETGRRA